MPILIYVVIKANPPHLLSNVESVHFPCYIPSIADLVCRFIQRFRNPTKLQSEAGYYLSSLVCGVNVWLLSSPADGRQMGAVSFIETMDHSSLSNITQEEFER